MSKNDFAFIGGAATGTMFLIYLAQKVKTENISLREQNFHLIDPKGFGNGGIAYADCSDKELLNSVRTEMSPWNPQEFNEWCKEKGLGNFVNTFNRRTDFGLFLKEKFDQSIQILKNAGAGIIEHECKAVLHDNNDGSFDIINQETKALLLSKISNNNIALTPGYGGPNESFLYLKESNDYIHNLYDRNQIQQALERHEKPKIIFIGAGAALNDFVIAYPELTEKAELKSYSINGEPLGIRDTSIEKDEVRKKPSFLHTKFNNAAQLNTAIREELENDKDPKRSLRRRALDLTNSLNTILNNQTEEIAETFRKSALFTQLKHNATPVPPESNAQLNRFEPEFVSKRLNGSIKVLDRGGFELTEPNSTTYKADIIINGTGHQNIPPIIQDMINNGSAQYNQKTGTAKTTEDGTRLAGCEISCAGPAVNAGTHGMESHAPITEKIADNILKTINGNSKVTVNEPIINSTFIPAYLKKVV